MKKKPIKTVKQKKEKKIVSKQNKAVKSVKAAKSAKDNKAGKASKVTKAVKVSKQPKVKKEIKLNKIKSSKPKQIMVQHLFKIQGNYKAPDGRVFRVVLSEVYNLRCFEVVNGNLVGPMVKIHPKSDFAKSLVEVTG
jgi:hypothetical protein